MTAALKKPRIVRGVDRRYDVKTAGGAKDQWFTSLDYAAHIVRWAGVRPGMRVLDYGAGVGNITLALIGAGAVVTAVEMDRALERRLRARVGDRASVVIADFFDPHLRGRCPGGHAEWDLALGNPPWSLDNETRFLRRGLELAPRCVGIISLDGLVSGKRFAEGWRWMRETREVRSPGRLSFSENGRSGQEYPVAVEVVARTTPRQLGDEDLVRVSYYVPPQRAGR